MPELPEIETIRRALIPNITGKIISNVEVYVPKQFVGSKEDLIGAHVHSLSRKGKYLAILLSNHRYLNVHLKMSGQLFFAQNNTTRYPATRIVIGFQDKTALIFNDVRKFGWIKVTQTPEGPQSPDILADEFTSEYLYHIISKSQTPIKLLLLDQAKLAGMGNIYANDALFLAGILPTRRSNSLSEQESKRLYTAIKDVINEGINLKGSSASEVYKLPDGTRGGYQTRFKVYSREDKPCLMCGNTIKRVKHGGRSSFFCPQCQH